MKSSDYRTGLAFPIMSRVLVVVDEDTTIPGVYLGLSSWSREHVVGTDKYGHVLCRAEDLRLDPDPGDLLFPRKSDGSLWKQRA